MNPNEMASNFINGKWSWPTGCEEIPSVNPADTNDVIAIAPDSTSHQVDLAVKAAKEAYKTWKLVPAPQRAEIIRRAGDLLTERKILLGRLVTRECGKPYNEGQGDVQEAIDMAYLAAGEGRRLYGETTESELPDRICLTTREPVGVCGLITPWNFPIAIPAWKTFHALVCGNTVVFKPAENTPLCAVKFIEILIKAGVPPGVVNLVHGRGKTVGKALTEHPDVQLISFTGSTKTGKTVSKICAEQGKRVSLEMGGKNAEIIMPDANLDLALDGALWGAFGTGGQRCTATSRLIVHEDVHDEVVERLVQKAVSLNFGNGMDKSVHVGPLINEVQFNNVLNYIQIGKDEGAVLKCGGGQDGSLHTGYFVRPTVFTNVTRDMRIFREEIFGPVISVIKVKSLDEAIETLNDCAYGLSSSIYTQDINAALRAVKRIEAGIVYVNGPTIGAEVHMPFGGTKGTGNGHREAGKTGLDIFTEWKTVYIDYSGKLQRVQIDTGESNER